MGRLTEKEVEQLTERLVNRIEEGNSYTLEVIGEALKGLDKLTPTQAHKITQVMKYGGNYDKIAKKLAEITGKNLLDIKKIFEEVAKKDLAFAEQFYKYRDIKAIPYNKNEELQKLVNGYIKKAQKEYLQVADMSLTGLASKSIGFSVKDKNGKTIFKGLKDAYYDAIDNAILNVSTGLMTANEAKRKVINSLAGSGIKKMDFKNGRSIRMDSIVRMNIQSSLRDLHNQLQEDFGKEYGADGVEISVHGHPAEDHQLAQGRQFSNEEYQKLQKEGKAKTYEGKEINIHLKRKKSGKDALEFRPISEYNCYHYVFAIILGVNKPEYSDEELKKIIDNNNKKVEFEGKKYTTYEMTQLQREIEREVRKEKDLQTMAKASGNKEEVIQHQKRIKELLIKYNEVSNKAGLPTKKQRLTVSGYHYIPYKVQETPPEPSKMVEMKQKVESNTNTLEDNIIRLTKEEQERRNQYKIDHWKEKVASYQADVKTYERDIELIKEKFNSASYYKEKYETPERLGSNTYSHYKIAKSNLAKAKERLKEVKSLEFEDKEIKLVDYDSCKEALNEIGITLDTKNVDNRLLIANTKRIYGIMNKYPWVEKSFLTRTNKLRLGEFYRNNFTYAHASRLGYIEYNTKYCSNLESLVEREKKWINNGWHQFIDENNAKDLTITHEMGHQIEYILQNKIGAKKMYVNYSNDQLDTIIMDKIYDKALYNLKQEKLTSVKWNKTLMKNRWLSDYGKSKRHYEAFAELFSGYMLGDDNPITQALGEYLDEIE